jgi:SAM-dependent methyltransferase
MIKSAFAMTWIRKLMKHHLTNSEFYVPGSPGSPDEPGWNWYLNIVKELNSDFLATAEKAYLRDYYTEAGLLTEWRRPYFRYHFSRSFDSARQYLMGTKSSPLVLDLGCGCGTQSLFFALRGARVIGIDMDSLALTILQKRRNFYQEMAQRPLDITVHCVNSFEFDYATIAPIDGVYSMFAFNLMQPSSMLMDLLQPHLGPRARLAIIDGNHLAWRHRFSPSRRRDVWTPPQFRAELERRGFAVQRHLGGVVIPPVLWGLLPEAILTSMEGWLGRNWLAPISHQIYAERQN